MSWSGGRVDEQTGAQVFSYGRFLDLKKRKRETVKFKPFVCDALGWLLHASLHHLLPTRWGLRRGRPG